MSLLSRGRLGGRARALVTAVAASSLVLLGLIGAVPAQAATSCVASGSTLTISMQGPASERVVVFADANLQVWTILNGAAPSNCGAVQLVSTLTSVSITGVSGLDQFVTVGQFQAPVGTAAWPPAAPVAGTVGYKEVSWGSVKWTVSLGNDAVVDAAAGVPDQDTLMLDNSMGDTGSNVTLGANGIDLTTDGTLDMTVSGVKATSVIGAQFTSGPGLETSVNTLNAGGDTITGAAYAGNLGAFGSNPVIAGLMGGDSDDTLTGGAGSDFIIGGPGFDEIAGGALDDVLNGGSYVSGPYPISAYPGTSPVGAVTDPVGIADATSVDIVTFASSTTGVNANLQAGVATGEGVDQLVLLAAGDNTFERLYGTAANDTLTGDDQADRIRPSKGDDVVDGGGNPAVLPVTGPPPVIPAFTGDVIDYSDIASGGSASAPNETVDMNAQTAKGAGGNDTFTHIEGARGSQGVDLFVDNITANNQYDGQGGNDTFDQGADPAVIGDSDRIDGGSGIDKVDYSQRTDDLNVDLTNLTCPCGDVGTSGEADVYLNLAGGIATPTVENAALGTGNDTFVGTQFNNTVWPGGGQNSLAGCGPIPPAVTCAAGGIDTVNYSVGYGKKGVVINLAGGGQAGLSDSIVGFANAIGSPGPDTMIGTDVVGGTNGANRLVGGKGNDSISANAGPDFVQGGAGNDKIRGGTGDDTLKGQAGNDFIRGGPGDDDLIGGKGKDNCNGGGGHDVVHCEKKHQKSRVAHARAARLSRVAAIKP